MAKKGKSRKGTKRPTKAGKRGRASARGKGGAFQSTAFQQTAFDPTRYDIAASLRKLSAAMRSTSGEVRPPSAPLDISTSPPEVRVVPPPGLITPTVYPDSPQGPLIIHNHITINIRTNEFKQFNTDFELLIRELRYSNEISGEIRDQLLSELKAGREIITGPKPQRDLIDLLLVRPLKWLAEKSGSAIVSKLAADALTWLFKIIV